MLRGHVTPAAVVLRLTFLIACCAVTAAGQKPMAMHATHYEVRAGETVRMVAPAETLDFLAKAASRQVEIVGGDIAAASGGLVAAPNSSGDQILLGASLRLKPGEYTVNLSATGATGEQRQTPLTVLVQPRVSVPSNSKRPPVVLLNGWQTGITGSCLVANSSSETFGSLAQQLVSDGVPVVYLFDNCLEDPGQTIEVLGNDLSDFLSTIVYDTGAQVPQIDLVGFSLGGLVARSYLAGLQPNQALKPPTTTLVRKLVLIATPNFGSFAVGNYATSISTGTQSAELIPGSSLLWNLATWNQRTDDLRGLSAIAVIGNAGAYTPGLSSSTTLLNASDGLVSLTSAALGFTGAAAASTRIVPYCHVDPAAFTNSSFGTYNCNAGGIANVNSSGHYTGLIVRSFLAGTTDWQSIGATPASDPYLSKNGAMHFALVNAAGNYVSDLTGVSFGGVSLTNGGNTGTIFYLDYVLGTGALAPVSTSLGTLNCGSLTLPAGFTSALRCKLATVIVSVSPLATSDGRTVNAGTALTLTGNLFGTQCSGCKVIVTPAGSTTSQTLTVTSWSNTSITVNLPSTLAGMVTLQVSAVSGNDALVLMVNPQSTLAVSSGSLQFAATTDGAAPAAQTVQITNSGSGTLAWTASPSASWISVSPASGTAPSTLSVTVSPAGLSAGTYSGSVAIAAAGASNTPASIGVTFTVTDLPAALAVSPQALNFQYSYGGAAPPAQNVAIANGGGGALAWTATTGAYWLGLSAASGNGPATLAVSVSPANLAAGTYTQNVQISAAGAAGSPATVAVTLVVTGTQPAGAIASAVSAANFQPGVASGTWVAIFGSNLSAATYTWQNSDFVDGKLPTSLQGVSVMINGVAAYVEYISPTQINVLAPDDAAVGAVSVQVTAAGQASNSVSIQKTAFAPAFFTLGDGVSVAALHQDYSLVAQAKPGETILLYGTGFGPTNPPLPAGQLVTTAQPLANPVQISIGGVAATVGFGGLVGPGLYQFNVTVPNVPNGNAAVAATIGGVTSPTGVSVNVQ